MASATTPEPWAVRLKEMIEAGHFSVDSFSPDDEHVSVNRLNDTCRKCPFYDTGFAKCKIRGVQMLSTNSACRFYDQPNRQEAHDIMDSYPLENKRREYFNSINDVWPIPDWRLH